jgi:hypothetical protein
MTQIIETLAHGRKTLVQDIIGFAGLLAVTTMILHFPAAF